MCASVGNKAGRSLQVVFAGTLGPGVSLVNACLAQGLQLGARPGYRR